MNTDNGPTPYRQFREEPYRGRLKALLEVKGGPLQKEFLASSRPLTPKSLSPFGETETGGRWIGWNGGRASGYL